MKSRIRLFSFLAAIGVGASGQGTFVKSLSGCCR